MTSTKKIKDQTYDLKFIIETEKEKWKTIHSEVATTVTWDEEVNMFLCKSEMGTYYNEWHKFFQNHVIIKNNGFWRTGTLTKNEIKQNEQASWLCFINGYNICRDMFGSYDSTKHNVGNNLLSYIHDRMDDAIYTLKGGLLPDWLADYVHDQMEVAKLEETKPFRT